MTQRSFLLLQGVATPFFSELGKALEKAGYQVLRVNFCGGDFLSGYWFSAPLKSIHYRGGLNGLAAFYHGVFDDYKVTDILLFGDTRPVHTPAIEIAKHADINVHVFEEGYFRPHWITLDNGGVNAFSSLPKDPEAYENYTSNQSLATPQNTGGGLAIRAWYDIRYHGASLLLKGIFPHYQSHRLERASKEYWGWVKRFSSLFLFYNKQSKRQINALFHSQKPFYLLPLQLDADSQMRVHSPIKTVSALIQTVIESFANHAPADSILVIKVHPLDPWFINYSALIQETAMRFNVEQKRIIYLESGDLNTLLKHAKATVLVNSTVGTSALELSCPVIALGSAIYNMAGLTFQGSLDDFWIKATPPDKNLFYNFKQYVIDNTQIKGSYYHKKGIELAVRGSLSYFLDKLS